MKKIFLVLTAVFGLLCSPAYAQLKNMILIEEATNASCPPCAAENPILEQFVQDNSDDVIQVSYHAWWPGSTEIMYMNDKTMNEQRINYYGFGNIGVPACVVGGSYATATTWYKGAPGDIDALTSAVDSQKLLVSPVTLDVKRFTQLDSEQVLVTVATTAALTNASLRVIVVEGEHEYTDAGNNGETIFRNIARKMLPSYVGKKFTLAAGASTSFVYKYQYNTEWTTDQLRIIAFVQTDKDKAITAAVQTVDPPAQGFMSGVASKSASGFSLQVIGTPMSTNEKINYTLEGSMPMKVTFSVIDLLGREVRPSRFELVNPGTHVFDLQGTALAAGMYRVIARIPDAIVQVPVVIGH